MAPIAGCHWLANALPFDPCGPAPHEACRLNSRRSTKGHSRNRPDGGTLLRPRGDCLAARGHHPVERAARTDRRVPRPACLPVLCRDWWASRQHASRGLEFSRTDADRQRDLSHTSGGSIPWLDSAQGSSSELPPLPHALVIPQPVIDKSLAEMRLHGYGPQFDEHFGCPWQLMVLQAASCKS